MNFNASLVQAFKATAITFGLLAALTESATAQTPTSLPRFPQSGGSGFVNCPSNYTNATSECRPSSGARHAVTRARNGPCPKDYEGSGDHYCQRKKERQTDGGAASSSNTGSAAQAASGDDIPEPKKMYQGSPVTATLLKADRYDMCPGGFRTDNTTKGHWCVSTMATPTTVRLKGNGSCKTGEITDYDKYCVSNIEAKHSTLRSSYISDFNSMWAIWAQRQSQGGPKFQHDVVKDVPPSVIFAMNRDEPEKSAAGQSPTQAGPASGSSPLAAPAAAPASAPPANAQAPTAGTAPAGENAIDPNLARALGGVLKGVLGR
jgi:hypothetical protein